MQPDSESPEPTRNNSSARGRHWRWVVFTPTHTVTWDNFKLGQASGVSEAVNRRREARG